MHPSPPPFAGTVFCSISNAKELLFSYNGGSSELEALAYVWLKKVPLYHAWYSHTTPENRTIGILMEDGYTYFAIGHCTGNLKSLLFLKSLRDGFMKASKTNGAALQDELDALVRSLIHSSNNGGGHPAKSGGGLTVARPAMAVPVALISPRDRKKGKDRGTEQAGDHNSDKVIKIDIAQDHGAAGGGMPVAPRRGTNSKLRAPQQNAQKQWRRHVKVVVAIDVGLCLVLLVAWLVVCRGVQCVASSSS